MSSHASRDASDRVSQSTIPRAKCSRNTARTSCERGITQRFQPVYGKLDSREKIDVFSPKTPASHSQMPRKGEGARPSEDREPGGVLYRAGRCGRRSLLQRGKNHDQLHSRHGISGAGGEGGRTSWKLPLRRLFRRCCWMLVVDGGFEGVWFFSEKAARGN